MFMPLTEADMKDIVNIQVAQIQRLTQESGITLTLNEYAMDWIVRQGYNPAYGARPIKRLLQKELVNELSKQILAGNIGKNQKVTVDCFDDGLVFRTDGEAGENVDR
jgi:ATP-dependent Clp protease ATP-binding subunit ClpB